MQTYNQLTRVRLAGEQDLELVQPDGACLRGSLRDTGEGALGIFVHGFRSHSGGEKSLALARYATVRGWSWLRFDQRGHGVSSGRLEDQDISSGVADLEAVLDRHADRPVVLVGSSLGGWVSLIATLRRPQQVRGLLLIAPAFNFIQLHFASLPDEQLKHWRAHGRMTFPDEYRGDSYTLPFSILADAERHDVIRTRPRLDLPVHIVHGDADAIVPLGNTRRFIAQSTIPRLTLDVVPGGDHRLSDHLPLLTRHLAELWQETES